VTVYSDIYEGVYGPVYGSGAVGDSLIIAESIELMGGGVPSPIAACAGAYFRLGTGFDLGEPDPASDYVASLVLDGEIPVGRRAGNRAITLPVTIMVPQAAGVSETAQRTTLIAAREVLLRAVNAEQWTLRWTREGSGLPTLFDCYRAGQSAVTYDTNFERQGVLQLSVTFPAAPYGRSDTPVSVTFQAALAGMTAPPSPVTVDSFAAVSGAQWSQSLIGPGPHSAHWNPAAAPALNPSGAGLTPVYVNSGPLGLNLTGLTALTFYAGFGCTTFFANWLQAGGPVHFLLTMTDSSGHVLTFSKIQKVYGSDNGAVPKFTKVRVPIPASAVFSFANVAAYSLTVTNRGTGDLQFTDLYIDSLTAVPPTTPAGTLQRGVVYDLAGMTGSARTAPSFQFQQPGTLVEVTRTLNTPGAGQWVAPALCTTLAVAGVGPGGAGSTVTSIDGGGGGGGGGTAASAAVAVTPGGVYPYNIGAGAQPGGGTPAATTFSGDTATVTASGGASAAPDSAAGGAGAAGGGGGHAGGTGGAGGSTNYGGGGGSSGGSSASGAAGAAGTSGAPGAGGAAPAGGGPGGAGSGTGGTYGLAGAVPGGGGGGGTGIGGPASWRTAGPGGNGQLKLTYLSPPSFQTLVAHRPGFYADENLCPFVTLPPGAPPGSAEYPVTSLIAGANARFNSTYSVVVVSGTWSSPSASRTVTVTVKQYEQPGGASYSQPVSWTFTPSALPLGTPFVTLGNLTIPANEIPPGNLAAYYTVTVTDTNAADVFYDVLFLDTQGSTVMLCTPNQYVNFYIDAPWATRDIGLITGSAFGRGNAVSVLAGAQGGAISGGPLTVEPDGNQSFLCYAVEGAPSVEMTYLPRWLTDRLS
jgi:hypothetical protein